jgi:hypothetical protein
MEASLVARYGSLDKNELILRLAYTEEKLTSAECRAEREMKRAMREKMRADSTRIR